MHDGVQEVLDKALTGEGSDNFELRLRAKSSQDSRHLWCTVTTRRDARSGKIVGVIGRAQDVTERDKVAGMALELRQLIDTANAPIFGIDVNGCVCSSRHEKPVSQFDY